MFCRPNSLNQIFTFCENADVRSIKSERVTTCGSNNTPQHPNTPFEKTGRGQLQISRLRDLRYYFGKISWYTVFDVPPSGGGLKTCTATARLPMIPTFCAGPGGLKGSGDARATALGGRSNSRRRGLRNVVLTEIPSTRPKDVVVNPLPSSITRIDDEPSWTRFGSIELIVGAMFDATIGRAGRTDVKYSGW